MTDMKIFMEKLFLAAKAAGMEEYELYSQGGATFTVQIFNGEVSQYTDSTSFGISFRGKYNGKMGYASSERVDDSVIEFLVNSAKECAQIIEEEEVEEIYPGDPKYPTVDTYSDALNAVDAERKIAAAIQVEASCKAADSRIQAVPYCTLGSMETEVFIANSKGLDISRKANGMYSYAYAQAAEGTSVKMDGDVFSGLDFDKFNPEELGKSVAQKAVSKLGAESVPSAKYAVVFDNSAAADLLSTFLSGFSAEHAQKGFSLLKGKIDSEIASPAVTIIDDPLMVGQFGTTPFDSEGVASYTKTVVDGGIFKTFLHNTKSAKKDGVKSTGNGFKRDFKSPVAISATNFFIKPSDTSQAELLAKMGEGIMITDLQGLHSGANPISGDFSLSADGFLIEGGKVTRPIEQITISGNFFQMLKDVTAVGNELEFKMPSFTGNVASPSVWVAALDVAGI